MAKDKIFTGALGILKVDGIAIGKAKTVRASESMRRVEVQGIGTIFDSEKPIVKWTGTLSCSFMSINFKKEGLPNAIRRIFTNISSQVFAGEPSFEDQLVLDSDGITLDIYKKVEDAIDPVTKLIKPKAIPYVTVRNLLIEQDGFDLSEGAVVTHDQSFSYLTPVTFSS